VLQNYFEGKEAGLAELLTQMLFMPRIPPK
jgi:hypothetical protein